MINGGLLALLTRVVHGIFNGGGDLGLRLHFYPSKQSNQSDQYKDNAQSHYQLYNVMFMVTMC